MLTELLQRLFTDSTALDSERRSGRASPPREDTIRCSRVQASTRIGIRAPALDREARRFVALEWTLRVGACLCFVGHGAFGIMTKPDWVPYFAVAGISRDSAFSLMPVIGAVDVLLGILVLIRPRRALLLWMTIWAVWTAMLRPLSGEPVWEMLERAGNYGVPFALLMITDSKRGVRNWLGPASMCVPTPDVLRRLRRVLVDTTSLLLLGHGALGLIRKPGLTSNLASVFGGYAPAMTPVIGAIEIGLAVLVLVHPSVRLAVGLLIWKIATESLFLTAGLPAWEVVERGGSYAAPLALAITVALLASRVTSGAPHILTADLER